MIGCQEIESQLDEMYGISLAPGWKASQALRAAPGLGIADTADPFMPFGTEEGASLKAVIAGFPANPPTGIQPTTTELMSRYLTAGPAPVVSTSKARLLPDPEVAWRRIDDDWLFASADLAMQFDSRTNNTSLVLAFEIENTGRVMLFAADAQIGNWMSWQDIVWNDADNIVTGPDLLARTVYLKVGHHGSERARQRNTRHQENTFNQRQGNGRRNEAPTKHRYRILVPPIWYRCNAIYWM